MLKHLGLYSFYYDHLYLCWCYAFHIPACTLRLLLAWMYRYSRYLCVLQSGVQFMFTGRWWNASKPFLEWRCEGQCCKANVSSAAAIGIVECCKLEAGRRTVIMADTVRVSLARVSSVCRGGRSTTILLHCVIQLRTASARPSPSSASHHPTLPPPPPPSPPPPPPPPPLKLQ